MIFYNTSSWLTVSQMFQTTLKIPICHFYLTAFVKNVLVTFPGGGINERPNPKIHALHILITFSDFPIYIYIYIYMNENSKVFVQ